MTKAGSKAAKLRAKRTGRPRKSHADRFPCGKVKPEWSLVTSQEDALSVKVDDRVSWVSHNSIRVNSTRKVDFHKWLAESAADTEMQEDLHSAWEHGAVRVGARNCVYFMRMNATDYYKVGCARNATHRACQINGCSPYHVELVSWVSFKEQGFHRVAEKFAHLSAKKHGRHLSKEWFELDSEGVRKVITDICQEWPSRIVGVSYGSHVEA